MYRSGVALLERAARARWGMTMNHDIARQIEDLVRQHVDTLRTAAAAVTAALAVRKGTR
jgi:hypothetical protein